MDIVKIIPQYDSEVGKYLFPSISLTKQRLKSQEVHVVYHNIEGEEYSLSSTMRVYLPLLSEWLDSAIMDFMEANDLSEEDIEGTQYDAELEAIRDEVEANLKAQAQETLSGFGIPPKAQVVGEIQNTEMTTYCDIDVIFLLLPSSDHTLARDKSTMDQLKIDKYLKNIRVTEKYALKYMKVGLSRDEAIDQFASDIKYYFPWNTHWAIEYGFDVEREEDGEDLVFHYYINGDEFVDPPYTRPDAEDLFIYGRELRPIMIK